MSAQVSEGPGPRFDGGVPYVYTSRMVPFRDENLHGKPWQPP